MTGAVRRAVATETGITALQPLCSGEPVHVGVHPTGAAPQQREPAHHIDVRFLFRTRCIPEITPAGDGAGAESCGPSQLDDPVLRARVLKVLGRPQQVRPAKDDPYGTLVVITNRAG
ncbi:hypothetical protein [Streptomyces sp. CMB-StM0423]|uniref:hypothetical protein n=1 Tax=Streptomyces sp. CMB-StM0423 TaxID=2059884 RepID=UPI001F363807|nr:hypothetical protein [Streptomyces sp. CMB-StM0423]